MQVRAFVTVEGLSADADVVRFTAREALAALFEVDVTFACDTPDLDLEQALWKVAVVTLVDDGGGEPRYFHGVVEEADYEGTRAGRSRYRFVLRPRLHGLAYRARSRIFQSKTALEVVQRVLRDAGLPASGFDWGGLSARYPAREYCVQYRESERDFVLRLLEDEGVFWRFDHAAGDHVMVFGDSPAAQAALEGEAAIPYVRGEHQGRERVADLVYAVAPVVDAFNSRDWLPEMPQEPREAQRTTSDEGGFAVAEYPGGFRENGDGLRRATARLEALRVGRETLTGRANVRRLAPGRKFTVAGAAQASVAREWLVTGVEHRYVDHGLAGDGGALSTFDQRFTAIPSEAPFRPARVTPRPRAWGKDSAVVTGPSSEEIHVDEMGRVKVHFYWDREQPVDDTASCWVRVQQQNTSGAMVLPRVGWEVSVGYLDGDPDRPVVLQKLYNRETMAPYEQPASATQTALQSATSPGGGSTNEVRLQDGNGGMEFFVHASRDLRVIAGHDLAETVDVDAAEEVGVDLTCQVGASQTVHVGGAQATSVTGTSSAEVTGARAVTVGGNDDWGVKANQSITVAGSRTETIDGLMNVLANTVSETFNADHTRKVGAALMINSAIAVAESVGGSKREQVGAARLEVVRKAYAETVGTSKTLVSGAAVIKAGGDIQASAQGALAVNVAGAIAEKCGGAYSIGARIVTVTTANLELKGGGSSLKCAGGKIRFKGGGLSVKGTVSVKLKGSVDFK
ncbi:MAG: type VI secretion system tip protein TssI/VgrG [Polyangiales bacterium]